MSTTEIVVLVLVLLVVAAIVAALVAQSRKRKRLQSTFGPEYDRTVESSNRRRDAERELAEREQRRRELDIRPLPAEDRRVFSERWRSTQADFVDQPEHAVRQADALVTEVMGRRGYPVGDFEQMSRDVSVDHATVVQEYRAAHEISELNDRDGATTEQLRQAMVHYRALFTDLLSDSDDDRHGDSDGRSDTGSHSDTGSPSDSGRYGATGSSAAAGVGAAGVLGGGSAYDGDARRTREHATLRDGTTGGTVDDRPSMPLGRVDDRDPDRGQDRPHDRTPDAGLGSADRTPVTSDRTASDADRDVPRDAGRDTTPDLRPADRPAADGLTSDRPAADGLRSDSEAAERPGDERPQADRIATGRTDGMRVEPGGLRRNHLEDQDRPRA